MFTKLRRAYRRPITEALTAHVSLTRWADGSITYQGSHYTWEEAPSAQALRAFQAAKWRGLGPSVMAEVTPWISATAAVVLLAIQP